MKRPRGLLFLCVANSARSQMAEGLARALLGTDWVVQSAGTRPSRVHPTAVAVLAEVGVDIRKQKSKSVQTIAPQSVDVVVTLCAEEVCPVFLGKAERLHWPFEDPASAPPTDIVDSFRRVRDGIKAKVLEFAEARA